MKVLRKVLSRFFPLWMQRSKSTELASDTAEEIVIRSTGKMANWPPILPQILDQEAIMAAPESEKIRIKVASDVDG
jgi:hypothetical protein